MSPRDPRATAIRADAPRHVTLRASPAAPSIPDMSTTTTPPAAGKAKRVPPGPPARRFLGNLPEFASDLLGFFTMCARTYGDVVRVQLGRRTGYLLTNPADIEQVLVGEHRNFIKHSFFWRHVRAVFGDGLLVSEGDAWLKQRRMIQPSFHKDRIAGYGAVMVEFADRATERWQSGDVRSIHRDMMALTLEIVAKVLFDSDVRADVDEVERSFEAALVQVASRFRSPFRLPDLVPTPGNLRYRAAVRRLDALVYRIIREHERRPPGSDLLSLLMATRGADGTRMPERLIRDEAVTLLLAGHETTALTLSWTWALLSTHPRVADRLALELRDVLDGRAPTADDLPRLRYTEQVVTESMRLYPPAYAIGREAVADCEIGGYHTPAGTTLFLSPWVMHRDPRWFDEPDAFRPERWDGGLAERLPRFVHMPFGGGPRQCIGNRFAIMEAMLILAAIARRFRLQLEPDRMPTPYPTITLRPRGGVPMRVARTV
jgi:cytochrome P450